MFNKLGTISLSPDILEKANIGLWAFELDEGHAPRMYADEAMLKLIGLDHQVSPEETYHAWYDNIDVDSYSLVSDAVTKMTNGEHAEVQYPWHHPDGRVMIVRCGGVRNYEYKKGIRIEGTHQDVTQVFHLDMSQRRKERENLLNYFVDSYESAYFVDLKNDTFEIIHMDQALSQMFGKGGNDKKTMIEFINKHVHPNDRDLILKIIDKDYIKNVLANEVSYTFTMREMFDGYEKTLRGQIIRGTDENHVAVGFMNITKEVEEQQKRLLGEIPLSPDVLTKSNIGLWAFELDEGHAPRMYADEAMLKLIGLDHQVSPEETYHAWYDNIDVDSYSLVSDAVTKMTNGEHAEVQYPWHFADGRTVIVRCGGVRNYEYKKGIRIEGTHQDVTQTLHFDEEERKRFKEQEKTLKELKIRAEVLSFVAEKDPDLNLFLNFFGKRMLDLTGGDQLIFRTIDGEKYTIALPEIVGTEDKICYMCPFFDFDSEIYGESGYVVIDDCSKDYKGFKVSDGCRVKSTLMQQIVIGGKTVGRVCLHYIRDYHTFTSDEIEHMKSFGLYLGLFLSRAESKKAKLEKIEAESSNKAKTEFLFNVSHDIRTPMNAILGFADIAINHIGDIEKVEDSLKKIKSSSNHLLNLINDILEMSRIEAGKLEITNSPLNIKEAISKVDIMSQSLAISKSVKYKSVIKNISNEYIFADELHVNQVLVNLISNAVKYTPSGGEITYIAEQISEVVDGYTTYRFTISDNGIGMSDEFQKHLFESFTREKTSTVAKQEGAGLGLAIVKRIVDLCNGTIKVISKKNVGSTFIVELPFKVMNSSEIESFITEKDIESIINNKSIFEGKKILLVEDNELNREIATELLTEAGFVVESKEDGELAVNAIKEKGTGFYDIVLMDIQMPILNGYDATKIIRKLEGGDKMTIIALSANAFDEDKRKSIESGMNDHIAKPINIKELFAALTKYIRK